MTVYSFGHFRYSTETLALSLGGTPLKIGVRALKLLHELLLNHGEVVGSEQLVSAVWPDVSVAESNLRVQMTVLRKALEQAPDGTSYITNVSGRGYCFSGAVIDVSGPGRSEPEDAMSSATSGAATRKALYGRSTDIAKLTEEIVGRKLVSVVGPGGIGKTSLAIAAAFRVAGSFPDGEFFIDLSTLVDGALVLPAIAAAVGSPVIDGRTLIELLGRLSDRNCLIILDNCEHVIAAAAEIADAILRACPGVHLLATSRELLMIRTEKVLRLRPLELPSNRVVDLEQAREAPAVALFIERAGSMSRTFEVNEGNIGHIVEICRRVDGIPLAIELAAARVDLFGVAGIHQRLGDMFNVLTRNRRTALPRQQTLRATLDWSFSLISDDEIRVLEIVSTLRSASPLQAIQAVAADDLDEDQVSDLVGALVTKSLLSADRNGGHARFRVLETTRSYLQDRLAGRATAEELANRHANYVLATFIKAEAEVKSTTPAMWLELYGWLLDDVRAALHWLMGPGHGEDRGIQLVMSSAALWFELSLLSEYQKWVETALARSRSLPATDRSVGLRLNMALGHLALQARGDLDEMEEAFSRASEAAENGTVAERGAAVASLWIAAITLADYAGAQVCAEKFGVLMAGSNLTNQVICRRMLSLPSHFEGRQEESRLLATEVLGQPVPSHRLPYGSGLQLNPTVSMNTLLTRIAWLQGRPDEALSMSDEWVAWAIANTTAASVCYYISIAATPVAAWCGDSDRVRRWVAILRETARDSGMLFWQKWAKALQLLLTPDTPALQFSTPPTDTWYDKQIDFLATAGYMPALAPAMARTNLERNKWCAPEVLRRWALLQPRPARDDLLDRALVLAQSQGAAGWRPRIAASQAEVATNDMRNLRLENLDRALEAIKGGCTTSDVRWARRLLDPSTCTVEICMASYRTDFLLPCDVNAIWSSVRECAPIEPAVTSSVRCGQPFSTISFRVEG